MNIIKILISCLMLASMKFNQSICFALMSGGEEKQNLRRALEKRLKSLGSNKLKTVSSIESLYLEGILYFAPDNWIVWMNGHEIRSSEGIKGMAKICSTISLHSVEEQKIYIKIPLSTDKYQIIPLHVHQTLDLETKSVREGDWRVNKGPNLSDE